MCLQVVMTTHSSLSCFIRVVLGSVKQMSDVRYLGTRNRSFSFPLCVHVSVDELYLFYMYDEKIPLDFICHINHYYSYFSEVFSGLVSEFFIDVIYVPRFFIDAVFVLVILRKISYPKTC